MRLPRDAQAADASAMILDKATHRPAKGHRLREGRRQGLGELVDLLCQAGLGVREGFSWYIHSKSQPMFLVCACVLGSVPAACHANRLGACSPGHGRASAVAKVNSRPSLLKIACLSWPCGFQDSEQSLVLYIWFPPRFRRTCPPPTSPSCLSGDIGECVFV